MTRTPLATCTLIALAASTGALNAQHQPNPLKNAYFGETHMHGALSLDAYIGGARLLPSDSYRFAKGEPVLVNGRIKQLKRPLDFAANSDHAEFLGELYSTMFADAPGFLEDDLQQLRSLESIAEKQKWFKKYILDNNRGDNPGHPPFYQGEDTTKSAWAITIDAAQEHNDPGTFTTFIAFEWTAAPGGANLHRNVIYRGSDVPDMPMSFYELGREDQLWDWMAQGEAQGMTALAIPHNSNASKGVMFGPVDGSGDPIDAEYAATRQHFEPLIEMMQIKGNSEVHRSFWAADEFADFENADSIQNYSGRTFSKNDFVREGLKTGLKHQAALGTNPFKYGFIGGTDSHNGLMADVIESDFIGGHGPEDGSAKRRREADVGGWIEGKDLSIGSLAGVWAPENTRAALWDAMKARETFATSGPRIKVRFFGGADLPADPPASPTALVEQGYASGVPMGGDLNAATAPTFTVHALKDPDGANLDRIQIIKGWLDASGDVQETIIDAVWAGNRQPDAGGKLQPVGNTADLNTARFTNDIGAPELMGSWTDDAFDPAQLAFYYARVLEIPTPRWSTYEALRNDLPLMENVPAIIQERAWSSPIWHTPG